MLIRALKNKEHSIINTLKAASVGLYVVRSVTSTPFPLFTLPSQTFFLFCPRDKVGNSSYHFSTAKDAWSRWNHILRYLFEDVAQARLFNPVRVVIVTSFSSLTPFLDLSSRDRIVKGSSHHILERVVCDVVEI